MKRSTEVIISMVVMIGSILVTELLAELPFRGIMYGLQYTGTEKLLVSVSFLMIFAILMIVPPVFQIVTRYKKSMLVGSLLGIASSIGYFLLYQPQIEGPATFIIAALFIAVFVVHLITGVVLSKKQTFISAS